MSNVNLGFTDDDFKDLAAAFSERSTDDRDFNTSFCKFWPNAKDALETFKSILDGMPGIGFFVKIAIMIVISGGDVCFKSICNKD